MTADDLMSLAGPDLLLSPQFKEALRQVCAERNVYKTERDEARAKAALLEIELAKGDH